VRGAVETVVRTDGEHDFVFLANRSGEPVAWEAVDGEVLIGERGADGRLALGPHGVAVLSRRTAGPAPSTRS
jgi:beta-galactosidase